MRSKFIVQEVSLEMISSARPILEKIAGHDSSVTDQVRRAASSVVLNIAEGAYTYSQGRNRNARFHTAAGSANETAPGLRLAVACGYAGENDVRPALELFDRVKAMLWTMTKR